MLLQIYLTSCDVVHCGLQDTKIVLLEELAATFQLKTQDAIDRLQKLVEAGELTGKRN